MDIPEFHPTHILVHYDEIALKGRNRRRFENRLVAMIRDALQGVGPVRVRPTFGRILVDLDPGAAVDVCCERLPRVFGVSRFSPAVRIAGNLEKVKELLRETLPGLSPRSFAVVCRRVNKNLPFKSTDVNRELGTYVQSLTAWPVRLEAPDLSIYVYLIGRDSYVAFQRLAGPGGLPAGSTGKVACLISGGIDSPVAAYRMLHRGVDAVFVHFHSHPHTSDASQDKVRELIVHVLPHGQKARLYLVPFTPLQQRIVTDCPPPYRVILYRRFMVRTAQAIARAEGAAALVSGESLGQVSSQTLENLCTIDTVATMPILRPLVGMNKLEIVDEARRIGTFETSIEPHDDCCSFLMPRNPATFSTPQELEGAEKVFDVEAEVETLVAASVVEDLVGGGA